MRAVLQRVSQAEVRVAGERIAAIGRGILALIGIAADDSDADYEWTARKITELRVFDDAEGKLNLSLLDVGGELLLVSQFTLLGDCRKGRRPSYSDAAPPAVAERKYGEFLEVIKRTVPGVRSGRFQAIMEVSLINSGPVTLILDSRKSHPADIFRSSPNESGQGPPDVTQR
jgi:D-tyrosyl-tRNA(Tyr) deacylase